MKAHRMASLASLSFIFALIPSAAYAYVGPGSGITVIGAALALVGGVILAIVGFIWYPVKRLVRRLKRRSETEGADPAAL